MFAGGEYARRGRRRRLLDRLATHPAEPWPGKLPFSFSGQQPWGSPQLDGTLGTPGADLNALLRKLRGTTFAQL